jgi:hypothetical protein
VLRFLVPAQVDFALEGPAAQVARERFVPGVLPAVRDQVGRLAERLAAHLTFVRFLACKTPNPNKVTLFLFFIFFFFFFYAYIARNALN